jgi:phenylacetate-coenzyme A ligase PaaK-like adenylate-forming protein
LVPDVLDYLLDEPALAREGPGESFLAAASVCLGLLRRRFPRFAEFLTQRTGHAWDRPLVSFEDLDQLPAVFVPVLKTYQFALPSDLAIVRHLTSSGTMGQPSVIPLDESSWRRRVQAMLAGYRTLDLLQGECTALAFLLDPTTTHMAGSLVIDAVLHAVPQVRAVRYLARRGPSGPHFDADDAAARLADAVRQGSVVLVGYPALIVAAIESLARGGQATLPLPAGSQILTGGGWKSFLPGLRLDQEEFRQRAGAYFDLPQPAIRDMFGLSECPAVFIQCEHDRYHVPAWCWAQAIDPESGRELPLGQEGLLQLTAPLTTSYPLLRILTTDRVNLGRGCPCGRAARFLSPRGRTAAARFETCAMTISQGVT